MSLASLVEQLVEERSYDALERLTGSRNEEVLDALIEAASRIISTDQLDPSDDGGIVDGVRSHLIDARPVGLLIDSLKHPDATVREFALSCLGEIGDLAAVGPMVKLLENSDPATREAAAAHLALLTKYDFGQDASKWREWEGKRMRGLVEQAKEDREDEARRLKLRMRGNRNKNNEDQR